MPNFAKYSSKLLPILLMFFLLVFTNACSDGSSSNGNSDGSSSNGNTECSDAFGDASRCDAREDL